MRTLTTCPPAPKPMEHRWGERVSLDCPALLMLRDDSIAEGQVRNASISGAWVETDARMPVYTALTVIVPAGAGVRRRAIELPACVVRTAPGGVAVEWRDMGVPTLISLLHEAGADKAVLHMRDHAFG